MGCGSSKTSVEGSKSKHISEVWFGGALSDWDRDSLCPWPEVKKQWFVSTPEFDQKLRDDYEVDILKSEVATIDNILLHDQVTRNIYRGSALAFSGDALALKLAKELLGNIQELPLFEAVFVLMPLMHSESLEDHNLCQSAFKKLHIKAQLRNKELGEAIEAFVHFETKHKNVIERFGRYPSRNQLLGRDSTPEEQEFLASGAGW